MKIVFIFALILLIQAVAYGAKYTGDLYHWIKLKESYNQGELSFIPELIKNTPEYTSQLVFLHFLRKPGCQVINRLKNIGVTLYSQSWIPPLENHPTGFMLAKIPAKESIIKKIIKFREIQYVQNAERTFRLNNDLASQNTGVSVVSSPPYNLTGSGVRISIIDSGFELGNADLPIPIYAIDYSAYPDSDFTVSNAHTGTGHGTHIAGSIVGQGALSSGVWKGMAPDAEWVALKVMTDYTHTIPVAALVHCYYASYYKYNADFINASLGGWMVYHDGSDEVSQVVDLISLEGCTVFLAAGNAANDDKHYSGTLYGGETSDFITVNYVDTTSLRSYYLFNLVWYDDPDTTIQRPMTLEFFDSDYNPIAIQTISDMSQSPRGTQSRYGSATTLSNNTFYLKVSNLSGVSLKYHLYAETDNCLFAEPDFYYTIESPGLADYAVSVGAWVTRVQWLNWQGLLVTDSSGNILNDIALFSSRGPRVDEYEKPNITAPGSYITSCRDDDAWGWPFGVWTINVISNDGTTGLPADYITLNGTSCSCPVACGAAALLKDYDPLITRNELVLIIENHGDLDGYTGNLPNPTWGYGKLNIEAALLALMDNLKPLPIDTVNIIYEDDMIKINWSPVTETISGRSIIPDYYTIYESDNPYSPVWTEIDTTSNTHYELSPILEKSFYQVRATYNP